MESNDEAAFSIELLTNLVGKSNTSDIIQLNTNHETISFGLSYNVVSGGMELVPSTLSFTNQHYKEKDAQTVSIHNSYNVEVKVLGISVSDPRFQVVVLKTIVPPESTIELFKLGFNLTYGQSVTKI